MTAAAYEVDTRQIAPVGESEWRIVWRRLRTKRLAMIALVVIVIIYGAGLLAPVLAPYSYTATNLDQGSQGLADHVRAGFIVRHHHPSER